LKLQAICAFQFICKNIVGNTYSFPEVWELERFDIQGHR